MALPSTDQSLINFAFQEAVKHNVMLLKRTADVSRGKTNLSATVSFEDARGVVYAVRCDAFKGFKYLG